MRPSYPMLLAIVHLLLMFFTSVAHLQSGVCAEALGSANLRAHDYVDSEKVGEIFAGKRYPVLGRSARYPWVLLGDPQTNLPLGWVFQDLLQIDGGLNSLPISEVVVLANSRSNSLPTPAPVVDAAVVGTVQGEINLRSGPGVEYPRLGVARLGQRYEILATHALFPWLRLATPNLSMKSAWVAEGLLSIDGDLSSLPRETQQSYAVPALTPTPAVVTSPAGSRLLTPQLTTLGESLWGHFLEAGFDFVTEPMGALYLYELSTGQALQFGEGIAFSGSSLTKIAILVELYRQLNSPPSRDLSLLIVQTMICSDNRATNELLRIIGQGDELLGASRVTATMRALGLMNSYLSAPYFIPGEELPAEARALKTEADQERNQPDPYNQVTVEDLGRLLGDIHSCAQDETGRLSVVFADEISMRECRSILHVMAANTVDSLLKSGVPAQITVAHKHGWIQETHGNAAIFFTPAGDYVLVMLLYKPRRLDFLDASLPLFAEVSREVYNHFNSDNPLAETRPGYIPSLDECNFVASPLLGEIQNMQFDFPP